MANHLPSSGGREPQLTQSGRSKMSDNAESPTETQKEDTPPPSDESTISEEKKKSKQLYIPSSQILLAAKLANISANASAMYQPHCVTYLKLTLILANGKAAVCCLTNQRLVFIMRYYRFRK